jgi:hypothetical protein
MVRVKFHIFLHMSIVIPYHLWERFFFLHQITLPFFVVNNWLCICFQILFCSIYLFVVFINTCCCDC